MNKPLSPQEAFYELTYYTLAHPDPAFIHQEIVDAFAAQTADENTKPIKITFALVGLYLYVEKGYTGHQVQLAHMQMAKRRKTWPLFDLPAQRGDITVFDVLQAPPGEARDEIIRRWCVSVWEAHGESHQKVAELVQKELYSDEFISSG